MTEFPESDNSLGLPQQILLHQPDTAANHTAKVSLGSTEIDGVSGQSMRSYGFGCEVA